MLGAVIGALGAAIGAAIGAVTRPDVEAPVTFVVGRVVFVAGVGAVTVFAT